MAANEPSDDNIIWVPGTPHPNYKVVAAEEKDHWVPAPGYTWAGDKPSVDNVVWSPGTKHPKKNLIAGEREGDWGPPPGYAQK